MRPPEPPKILPPAGGRAQAGFSLLELLVSVSVSLLLMWIVMQVTNSTSKVWRDSGAKVESFQKARAAFESITRNLRQATLNTYYDYYDASWKRRADYTGSAADAFTPTRYDRASELHFITGQGSDLIPTLPSSLGTTVSGGGVFFQAPRGFTNADQPSDALNSLGYFLVFGDDTQNVPKHVRESDSYQPRYRYRLMHLLEPAEKMAVYKTPGSGWFQDALKDNSYALADNIVALAILPMLPEEEDPTHQLAPAYAYDSRVPIASEADYFTPEPVNGPGQQASRHHQLPPVVRVAMVAVDETSMARLQGDSQSPAINFNDLFQVATEFRQDLRRAEERCQAAKLNYRVFSTEISLREARWSAE